MKKLLKKIGALLILLFVINLNFAFAQSDSAQNQFMNFNASYVGDIATNIDGGIKQGTVYLGMLNLKASLDLEKAIGWKNAEFFINAGNTHGEEPSANFVGDFQAFTNIEAGDNTYLYELWLKQTYKNFSLSLGLQDLNALFVASTNGGLFINSSFGIHSQLSDNIDAPIFPITALGATLEWQINDDIKWQNAVYDGKPEDFEYNKYNTEWKLNKNDGALFFTELHINKSLINHKSANYKIGGYYHEHQTPDGSVNNLGFYIIADQEVLKIKESMFSLFTQIGFSPKEENNHNYFSSLGVTCKGIGSWIEDEVGLAVAYASFRNNIVDYETAIELIYKKQLNSYIYIKPDLQYIINPAGTENKLNNAFVGTLRFGFDF